MDELTSYDLRRILLSTWAKSSQSIYKQNAMEKKRQYNQRVIQMEKANFTPLVFSTMGGMAPECTNQKHKQNHKQIAQLIALRTKEKYSHVMSYLRTRLRFTLLKSTLKAMRGERGRARKPQGTISDVSFNMIPDMPSYES